MLGSNTYKWVTILFFSVVGIMFTTSIFFVVTDQIPRDTFFGRKMTPPSREKTPPAAPTNKYLLEKDKPVTIANRIFIYRDRRADEIRLDVIIPELDRQYAYPFTLTVTDLYAGVEIAGVRLQLIAVRPHFVSLRADG